ncbi:MAG: macro domain-containing protein [Phycisphaerae bacterium]|nr:macro domain-containing protein [Phycisphaerae bacterium]
MIELQQGDILKAKADALVNTVNCVGVMGRGIALQFSKAFPEVLRAYEAACRRGEVQPGRVFTCDLNRLEPPHYVINVPTKEHWRGRSRMEYIEAGLHALVNEVRQLGIRSIAVPPLGCGLGGLDWPDVRPRIEQAFEALPDVRVLLFEPAGAPSAEKMAGTDKTPDMTEGRALLLGLMRRYLAAVMDPTVTLLEIHKLMYFMQESGQDLRLMCAKGPYGPYAENLRHVLTHIEGHFIIGYGDAADKPDTPIAAKAEAVAVAEAFLKERPKVHDRFDRVGRLIDGFETPYGMELLSTVHWVASREGAADLARAVEKTYAWSDRKRMFRPEHLRVAWDALHREGWLVPGNCDGRAAAKTGDGPRS